MAAEQGLAVDEEGFRRLMEQQRQRAKQDSVEQEDRQRRHLGVRRASSSAPARWTFTGYEQVAGEATVTGLLVGGASVPAAGAGTDVEVVLDRTPFYAEGGGQLADAGWIRRRPAVGGPAAAARVEVLDVQSPVPGLIVHRGKVVTAARSSSASRPRRRSTSSAGGPSPARTPRPTWSTGRSVARSASRPRRQARRTRRAGSASTSPPPAPCRRRCCGTPKTRSTTSSSTTWTCVPSSRPSTRRGRWARSRCSARNTATASAWSRSATTRASCAAARTWPAPASSGWSRSSASRRSAPACAGSRRWSAWTHSASSPQRACWSASCPSSSRPRREELPERVAGLVAPAPRRRARPAAAAVRQLLGAGRRAGQRRRGHRRHRVHRAPGARRHGSRRDPEARA